MKLNVGIISQIPNILKELSIRVPAEVSLQNITPPETHSTESNNFRNIDILIADYDLIGPHLYTLEKVKFIQGTWAGLDALMPHIKPDVTLNVPILRFSGKHFGRIISEYAVAYIVNHERDVFKMYNNQQKSVWSWEGKIHSSRMIYDLTIGVMGVGQIGSQLMNTLKFMGANVLGLARRPSIDKTAFSYIDEYYPASQLSTFLNKCDYIINTLPNTKETRGMLNTPTLEACKSKSPVFINVGRGGIISDESLLRALEENWLSHVYLDVFNKEPLPENHPLWSSPKVIITPHVAGVGRPQDIAEQFVENLQLFMKGEEFPTKIDLSRGY